MQRVSSGIDDVRQKKRLGKAATTSSDHMWSLPFPMVAGVKFASNSWTVGGRADLYTGAVHEMRRRQPLHNPGKFISARPPALLPLRALDLGSTPARRRRHDTPAWTQVSPPPARRVVSTCDHLRETCGEGRDHPQIPIGATRRASDYARNYTPSRRGFSTSSATTTVSARSLAVFALT